MNKAVDIELPEQLTIANLPPLQERFEALVDDRHCDRFVIHAEGVQRADTAGVQLLYAFVVAARERQIALEWDQPSNKLRTAVSILGMGDALGMQ